MHYDRRLASRWLFTAFNFSSYSHWGHNADSIITYVETIEDPAERIEAVYFNTSKIATLDPNKLLDLYKILQGANPDEKDQNALAHSYAIRGQYHAMAGQSDSIMFYRKLALHTFRKLPGSAQKASAYNAMSSNFYYQGELDKYLAYNDSAYNVLKQLEEPNSKMELMIIYLQ